MERMYFIAKQMRIVFNTVFVRIWNVFVILYGLVSVLYDRSIISDNTLLKQRKMFPAATGFEIFV